MKRAILVFAILILCVCLNTPSQTILTGGGYSGPTTMNKVAGSRAVDGTVYQNTGTTSKWITVSYRCASGSGDAYSMVSSASPSYPTDIVGIQGNSAGNGWGSITFAVPISWYYSVTGEGCTFDTQKFWTEWQ
jgi:hypothetical protein